MNLLVAAIAIATLTPSSQPAGMRYGVVAGCILPQVDKLNYTLADAKLVKDRLSIGSSDIALLTSDAPSATKPTKENLLRSIRQQAAKCGPQDTFWFYWSGHGTEYKGQSYILNYDCDPTNVRSMISVKEVRDIVKGCKARANVVILDSCHSGGTKSIGGKTWEELLGSYAGTVTLAASKVEETALELPELGHGLFTFFLIRGLAGEAKGSDEVVTLQELESYVCSQVTDFAKRRAHPQHPQFIYDRAQGNQAISNAEPGAPPPPIPQTIDAAPRPRLNPGIAMMLRSDSSQMTASAHNKIRRLLIQDKYPVVSDEAAKPFEDLLSSDPGQVGPQLEQWRSRYLLRGSIQATERKLSGDFEGLYSSEIIITAELIDIDGNVLGAFTSNVSGRPARASDATQIAASEKALGVAVDRLYPQIAQRIKG